jgi:hypothetical protein
MSDRYEDRAAVADKIEWEGGIMEALDYGIKSADMPLGDDDLIAAWDKLAVAYRGLQPLVGAVAKLLVGAQRDKDDE